LCSSFSSSKISPLCSPFCSPFSFAFFSRCCTLLFLLFCSLLCCLYLQSVSNRYECALQSLIKRIAIAQKAHCNRSESALQSLRQCFAIAQKAHCNRYDSVLQSLFYPLQSLHNHSTIALHHDCLSALHPSVRFPHPLTP
jgi:hypothetical protein